MYRVDGERICIGRSRPNIHSQCNFKDVRKMGNLYFHTDECSKASESIAKLLKREHYRFDSYPDVANLHLTHPEIFL